MTREHVEANTAESRQAFTTFDGAFAEAYSDKGLGRLQISAKGRSEGSTIDLGAQDIYASSDRKEPKLNESNEAERVTPLAQRQRADRLAANADVDQAATAIDKHHLSSSLKDNSAAEPKINEASEAERVTPLAQNQHAQRRAANTDLDQSRVVKER